MAFTKITLHEKAKKQKLDKLKHACHDRNVVEIIRSNMYNIENSKLKYGIESTKLYTLKVKL